ncbi:MAG: hypothetical protein H6741_34710 [Alphaproteobacteria bacterium]|nr:hypothetical protein [Alphaproteobacteria bacterium]
MSLTLEPHAILLFVGYPRSGHSLIGALLDAHPNAIVSHEVDALALVQAGASRAELLEALRAASARQAQEGRGQGHPGDYWYSYAVPGAWQGRVEGALHLLGDKKGGGSTALLAQAPALLDTLRARTGLPLKLLHVVRDPFDSISTMRRRKPVTLDQAITRYVGLVEVNRGVLEREPDVYTLYHERFVAAPEAGLEALRGFLELPESEAWQAAAASIVQRDPHRSREAVAWTPAQRDRVGSLIDETPWLRAAYQTR